MSQLPIEAFKVLRSSFFDDQRQPIEFPLRDKRNTQDDPFDEYVAQLLNDRTPDDVSCEQAPMHHEYGAEHHRRRGQS